MINPSHLLTLVTVIERGSFVAAANRLGYTPSAVSQQMAALEASVGAVLFERSARRIRPTAVARLLVPRASGVLAELESMQQAVNTLKQQADLPAEELKLSIYPSLIPTVLPFLSSLSNQAERPIRLRLSARDPSLSVKALVDAEDVDISVIYRIRNSGLSWPKVFQSVEIGEDPYLFVVPRSWGVHHSGSTSTDALAGRPWVFHHTGSSDNVIVESLFAAYKLHPIIVARADDFAVALQLAASGVAGAFVPRIALGSVPESAVVLNVPEVQLSRSVSAIVNPEAPPKLTDSLLKLLRDAHQS